MKVPDRDGVLFVVAAQPADQPREKRMLSEPPPAYPAARNCGLDTTSWIPRRRTVVRSFIGDEPVLVMGRMVR